MNFFPGQIIQILNNCEGCQFTVLKQDLKVFQTQSARKKTGSWNISWL